MLMETKLPGSLEVTKENNVAIECQKWVAKLFFTGCNWGTGHSKLFLPIYLTDISSR